MIPALSRNREQGPGGSGESEHLANCGSTNRPRQAVEPGRPSQPPDPPSNPGLNEGHQVTTTSSSRRSVAALVSLLALLLAGIALAAPAQAAAFRYWSYWQGATGTWVAAQTGPGDHVLVDEDVQGWRFGITTEAPAQMPDNAPDFEALCPQLAQDGPIADEVRVAVVIDSGFVADAPEGQTPPADVVACITLPDESTGNQALAAAAASLEDQGGLICAINEYPTDECGAEVSDEVATTALAESADEEANPAVTDTSAATDDDADSSSAGLLIGAAVVAVLVGSALFLSRRRATEDE